MKRLARGLCRLGQRMLPPSLHEWGEAAARELESLERPSEAVAFALGCLGWAAREAIIFHFSKPDQPEDNTMLITHPLRGPRAAALWCGLAAAALGLAYLTMADAPASYLMINLAAVVLGLLLLGFLVLAERAHLAPGAINLLLGAALLAVSQFGVSADGVTRWVGLGALTIQPSLMVVPVMLVTFARSRDILSMAGLILAALALSLQPDRAMAGALAAGSVALMITRPSRHVLAVAAAAVAGLAVTLIRVDRSPAVPFVDRILYSAFDVHPLAGLAVTLGSAVLVVPALLMIRADAADRPACAVFGASWAAVVLAAALGNYPTPLVGYGGSAIVGYLLSLIAFPSAASLATRRQARGITEPESEGPALYAGAS
jgi:hypothetical protein